MRGQRGILCIVFIGLFASNASAQDICAQLNKLLKDPPSGFLAERAELISPQRWTSKPFLANAECVLWSSRAGDADEIRCMVNDGASAAAVTKYYQDTERSIDRCLAMRPGGNRYNRRTGQVDSELLKGVETIWIHKSDVVRIQVDLANYRRTYDGSTYNGFTVEYLKY